MAMHNREKSSRRRVAAASVVVFLLALMGAIPSGAAGADEHEPFVLSIFHHNDAESAIVSPDEFGGASRFVSLTWRLRASARQAGRETLMLNAGDNYLASPEFTANQPWWFYDSMYQNLIKYDLMGVGNHEFDFGPDVFATYINGFSGGGIPPFVTANLDFSAVPSLAAQVDAGNIRKSVVIEKGGEQIGVVGATTDELPRISSPGEVVVNPVVPAVQAEIDALTAAGIDKIIFVSHLQGLATDREVIGQLRGIDAAIGGGGDDLQANPGDLLIPGDEVDPELPYPLLVPDADGNEIPLASGPGDLTYIGELQLTFDADGNVTAIGGGPHRVSGTGPDAVSENPFVNEKIVAPITAFTEALATNVIGTTEAPLNGERNPGVRTQETGLGSLVADSLLWQANELDGGADVALQNGGGIRNNDIIPVGPITELDTFEILPFPNFVTVVNEIGPAQFKAILERAYSGVEDARGQFAQIAGFEVVYDPTGAAQELDENLEVVTPGERIVSITLDDGTVIVSGGEVVAGAPSVNIATIDFLARGGDGYPFGDADIALLGVSYQQALSNFIQQALGGVISAADYPTDGSGRITAQGG